MSAAARRIVDWRLLQTAPDAFARPLDLPGNGWIAAPAPGTVAGALEATGRFDRQAPVDLDGFDHWLGAEIDARAGERLVFHGLAGLAEIFLDGSLVATSANMFVPCVIDIARGGRLAVDLRLRAMGPVLARRGARARWRPRAVQPAAMRFHRQTLIGRMPGWCPPVRALGLWRPVELQDGQASSGLALGVDARLEDGNGVLDLMLGPGARTRIACAGASLDIGESDATRRVRLVAPRAAPWFPHTHGASALHEVTATSGGATHVLGRVGFRTLTLDRDADGAGFGLRVNGERVFCRGANWISPDIVRLGADRDSYARWLSLARDAGMNMLRVPGSTIYEHEEFYALCDEMGILVWQDFMFANLDYPADDAAFRDSVRAEAEAFLARTRWSPSLVVFCGGAEVSQQAAMLGLPKETWSNALFDEVLPAAVAARRADAIWWPNTPSGGALPFQPCAGTSHYYGVSAHLRGVDDIRRSRVRFATECLGFAHAPAREVALENDRAAVAQPVYGDRIDGDTGAVWHFEGVRNHYVEMLYGVDVEALRREDPARWLDLSRAATGEVASELYSEWRGAASPTRGALTLFFQDVAAPGAGWGVVDHLGAPKPVWCALRRVFAPLALFMTDEGLNGAALTLVNETPSMREVDLVFECLREGATAVAAARRRVSLPPRGLMAINSAELLGGFFDVTHAFRFGAPSHDVVAARLVDPDSGETISSAALFPHGRGAARIEAGLSARIVNGADGWSAVVTTSRFAQNVRIDAPGFLPLDNWLHLAPRETRRIALRQQGDVPAPRVVVTALNAVDRVEAGP